MINLLIKRDRIRGFLLGALSLLLFMGWAPPLVCQQAGDLEIVGIPKDSKCGGSDGEVTIQVKLKPGHAVGHTIQQILYQLRNSNNVPMAPSAEYVQGATFLVPADVYTPMAQVSFTNGVVIPIVGDPVEVKTTYVNMTSVVTVERKSLRHFKKNGASATTPTGVISLFVKDGVPPYSAKILSCPSAWKGPREFSLEPDERKFIYEVPPGNYTIQINDGCRSDQAITAKMEYVKSDLPKGGTDDFPYGAPYTNWDMRTSNCGWIAYLHNGKSILAYEEETRDLFDYLKDADTLARYYNYAFQTIKDFKQGRPRKYYPAGKYEFFSNEGVGSHGDSFWNLYFRISESKSYEAVWVKEKYWPLLFIQVKGSSEEMREGYNPYPLNQPFPTLTEHYQEKAEPDNPCSAHYRLRLRPHADASHLMCLPLKAELREKGKTAILETLPIPYIKNPNTPQDEYDEGKYSRLQTSLDPKKHYIVTVTDAKGSKEIIDLPPHEDLDYRFRGAGKIFRDDLCLGRRLVDLAIRRYPVPVHMKKHKITFLSAPAGFRPIPGALAVGDVYTMPDDYTGEYVHVFAVKGKAMSKKAFHKIPAGEYVFEVEICDKKYKVKASFTEKDLTADKYSENVVAFKPKLTKEECGYARFYPFAGEGGTNFLLKNGVPVLSNLFISKLPKGIETEDIRTNLTGDALGFWQTYNSITAEDHPNPQEIYLDIPATNDVMEVRLVPTPEGDAAVLEDCLPPHTIHMASAALSYDREKYIGYICSTKTSGLIRIHPINYIGAVTVQLFKKDEAQLVDGNALATVKLSLEDLKRGKSAEFKLKDTGGIPIDPEGYKMRIKDDACQNTTEERLIVYSLPSPTVIKTEGDQRKYCEGETINISIVALNTEGDDAYTWHLPDGSTRKGRKIRLENVQPNLSGTFRVEVSGIVCDEQQTVETIEFPISVAPRLLWWRKEAENTDWHNVKNWADANGNPVNAVPAPCTTVHIPATVDKAFPDLGAETNRLVYGQPECDKLYLHYGSQLGNPHHLTYTQAYVDYNFGVLNASQPVEAYQEPHFPAADSKLLARDQWYMIAAPLKEILSGDFGLAGYPKTHQRYLKIETGGNAPTDASFKRPINNLIEKLVDHNSAMALKVGNYRAGEVGYKDHKNLNLLKGIIRLPFFEDQSRKNAYPLHSYDETYKLSTFGYYNEYTLQPINKTDAAYRSDAAYRFVFEGANKRIGTVTVAGVQEEGYALSLKEGLQSGEWFMVGNPFMTAIDFNKFYEANATVIQPYYYIFNGQSKIWEHYSKDTPGTSALKSAIAPMQAVVLHKKSDADKLIFPVGNKSVLLPAWRTGNDLVELRSVEHEESLPLMITLSSTEHEATKAYLNWGGEYSVPALSNSEYGFVPTIFFVDPETGRSNTVESPTKAFGAMALGVEASLGGQMLMSFERIDRSIYEELVLVDKLEGKEQDLLANATYSFIHEPSDHPAERFILKVKRFGIANEPTDLDHVLTSDVSINRLGEHLFIDSPAGVRSVTLFDMQGRQLGEWQYTTSVTHVDLPLGVMQGVLVLDLRLQDGSRRICKIDTTR